MKKEQSFWNSISKNYDKHLNSKYSKAYEDTIEKTRRYLKASDSVLDFGCGTGIITAEIALDVKEISALDYSEKMISVAEGKANTRGLKNIKFSISSIFDKSLRLESFDVILANNILCYIKDDKNTIKRIYDLLKLGGIFISVTDCLGEKVTFMAQIKKLLSRAGAIPFMNFYKMRDLEYLIASDGFDIIEKENLYATPPNYFIAAKKQ